MFIKVQYDPNDSSRIILKTMDQDLAVDDFVVVESSTRHEMTIAKVTDVDLDVDLESSKEMLWVVSRVCLEEHKQTKRDETAAIAKVQQVKQRSARQKLREELFKDDEAGMAALALTKQVVEPPEPAPQAPQGST